VRAGEEEARGGGGGVFKTGQPQQGKRGGQQGRRKRGLTSQPTRAGREGNPSGRCPICTPDALAGSRLPGLAGYYYSSRPPTTTFVPSYVCAMGACGARFSFFLYQPHLTMITFHFITSECVCETEREIATHNSATRMQRRDGVSVRTTRARAIPAGGGPTLLPHEAETAREG
jgi:hypothetical protein